MRRQGVYLYGPWVASGLAAVIAGLAYTGQQLQALRVSPPPLRLEQAVEVSPAEAVSPAARVVEVLTQRHGERLDMQVLIEGSGEHRVDHQPGWLEVALEAACTDARKGVLQQDGQALFWRVVPKAEGCRLEFVGNLEARPQAEQIRMERAGESWLLSIRLPIRAPAPAPVSVPAADTAQVAQVQQALDALPDLPPLPGEPRTTVEPTPRAAEPSVATSPPKPAARVSSDSLQERIARGFVPSHTGPSAKADADLEQRRRQAREHLVAGDLKGAIRLLQERPPALERDVHWHALLAAAYQQAEQWEKSRLHYARLLEAHPDADDWGVWQMGMGLALENLGRREAAIRHYQTALERGDLKGDGRQFVASRLSHLEG